MRRARRRRDDDHHHDRRSGKPSSSMKFVLASTVLAITMLGIYDDLIRFHDEPIRRKKVRTAAPRSDDVDVVESPSAGVVDAPEGTKVVVPSPRVRSPERPRKRPLRKSAGRGRRRRRRSGKKRAVAVFVDAGPLPMYGVYSIRRQMIKHGMMSDRRRGGGVSLVAVAGNEESSSRNVRILRKWLGEDNVVLVDKSYVSERLNDKGLWRGTFNKLWLFNLTEFEKVIVLDNDILILNDLTRWFDLPTPSATIEPTSAFEFNTGAMVIRPSTNVFDAMIDDLPRVREFKFDDSQTDDTRNCGIHDQGYLSALFSAGSGATDGEAWHAMGKERCVLSSWINSYYLNDWFRHRRKLFDAVHFTREKPWRKSTKLTRNKGLCHAYREWLKSARGAEEDLGPLDVDLLGLCKPLTNDSEVETLFF